MGPISSVPNICPLRPGKLHQLSGGPKRIARLHRTGTIDHAGKQAALDRLFLLKRGWKEILPDETLRDLAGQVLDAYTLCAADSLQLAAALTWCQQLPSQRSFISGDDRLSDAASSSGFLVKRLKKIP